LPPFPSRKIFARFLGSLSALLSSLSSRGRKGPFLERVRRRSVGFLENEGEAWACFLVTFMGQGRRWHGYFSFRPRDGGLEEDEVRTADIFMERTEGEIDRKARSLGRPLLKGLLASALHTRDRASDGSPGLRRWFRRMLAENSRELAGDWQGGGDGQATLELARLRSLYASYRLDQVCHFIALVDPEDFQEAVDRILEGRSFDFGAKDLLQFSMMVVEFIEDHLPLPPFEIWAEDFTAHRDDYALYAHTLHRAGRLP